jgi:4-hydroxy-2-oxoheptanedioate aldolase
MNALEIRMVELLKKLRRDFNVSGVKAEFEAEGTRIEEAMRLKEVATKADCSMTIKIGGCEAIKDMFEACSLGVDNLVGPMVETPYALKKYIQAVRTAFPEEVRENVEFLVNIETITSVENFEKMLQIPEAKELDGIVIGRVDLTGSLGLSRDDVNSDQILELCKKTARLAKAAGKKVVVGGGVSIDSAPFFKKLGPELIDRFETRKIVFNCPEALSNSEEAFLTAVEFELSWLKNKRAFYGSIHHEDDNRIQMLEARYKKGIEKIRSQK